MGNNEKKRKLAPWEEERKKQRAIERQRLYRAGLLKINPRISLGRQLAPKKENKHFMEEQASFACPNCGNDKKRKLLRRRPGFYECLNPNCPDKFFVKDEALNVDEWETDEY